MTVEGEKKECRFCDEDNPIVLIGHHIDGRRIEPRIKWRSGRQRNKPKSNEEENIAVLCANCHMLVHHYIRHYPDVRPGAVFKILLDAFNHPHKLGTSYRPGIFTQQVKEEVERRLKYYQHLNSRRSG